MSKIAFLFPGQGSQSVGMGAAFKDQNEQAGSIFRRADERLGFPLSKVIFEGPETELKLTENTQPAILTASLAAWEVFRETGIEADYTAGHSLGEYSALVAAGALSFEDAVYAVRHRGLYMEEAVPAGEGAMAAILGLEDAVLREIADSVTAEGESVDLANLNAPGQIVISGTAEGVRIAGDKASAAGAKRVLPLNVSGPFHSRLMKPAADKFKQVLDEIEIRNAETPVIANVTADEMKDAGMIYDNLLAQMYSPVRWEETVRKLLDLGVDTFFEIGPGNVLCGLVKRVNRRAQAYPVNDPESLEKALAKWKENA
ncbi:MAG TPA: ACP S-malonyltransferase [Bacillales bacterium]|nr:ACP S-malonyltransferase [Bacillales bacterium]